jgi:hypothetical protein
MKYSKQAQYKTLSLAIELAPNGIVQRAFSHLVNQMEADKQTTDEIIKQLVTTLTDGVVHGNWPFIPNPVPSTHKA